MLETLDLAAVRVAARRIAPYVLRTPVLRRTLGDRAELFFKAESLQPTGAFKLRGAFSRMLSLPAGCPGVVAHSSGNHAQAVARAARALGVPAVVVMPADAPEPKRLRTAADGAEVVLVGSASAEREACAQEIARERGLVPVPPYDDPHVAAGQGTCALELLEEVGAIDRFYAPISGGGLMAGCAVVVRALCPGAEIVGVEPEDANDTRLSLAAGERRSVSWPRTIADGLQVITPGVETWPVLRAHVTRVELVSDEELLDAMAVALRELRLVLEPSGAASLALALREGTGRCGVVLSGGNADPGVLEAVAGRPARGPILR